MFTAFVLVGILLKNAKPGVILSSTFVTSLIFSSSVFAALALNPDIFSKTFWLSILGAIKNLNVTCKSASEGTAQFFL